MIRCIAIYGGVLLASLSLPCEANDKPSQCDVLEREDYVHSDYPWQEVTPLEYLTYIKSLSVSAVTVHGCKEKWVTEADVSALLDLLDSKEPSPNQMSARSSFWDVEKSTVGNEAAWLIQAFRVGRFPPSLNYCWHKIQTAQLRTCLVLEYPAPKPIDLSGQSFEDIKKKAGSWVLAPYFSGAVLDEDGLATNYFVLGQTSMGGGSVLRSVTPDGANINLGEGPQPGLDAFLGAIEDQLSSAA